MSRLGLGIKVIMGVLIFWQTFVPSGSTDLTTSGGKTFRVKGH